MYSLRPDGAPCSELGDPQRYQAKVARQLLIKILELGQNPTSGLQTIDAGYRVDSGEYRIYYEVDDAHQVVTSCVGKRGDDEIYRRMKRKLG